MSSLRAQPHHLLPTPGRCDSCSLNSSVAVQWPCPHRDGFFLCPTLKLHKDCGQCMVPSRPDLHEHSNNSGMGEDSAVVEHRFPQMRRNNCLFFRKYNTTRCTRCLPVPCLKLFTFLDVHACVSPCVSSFPLWVHAHGRVKKAFCSCREAGASPGYRAFSASLFGMLL